MQKQIIYTLAYAALCTLALALALFGLIRWIISAPVAVIFGILSYVECPWRTHSAFGVPPYHEDKEG